MTTQEAAQKALAMSKTGDVHAEETAAYYKGGRDMKPGIHLDIPNSIYHGFDAVSNGYLKKLGEVPAKAKIPQPDTPAMLFGRAVHAYVLEGREAFDKEFCVAPKVDKRTTEGKAEWAEFVECNGGKDVVSEDDYYKIRDITDAVKRHPLAVRMLSEGISEVTAIWEDDGLLCKCRPDRIPDGNRGVILDLKTCSDASEVGFSRAVANFGYYRQAAWYIDGVNKAGGKEVDAMAFIAVEKEPPYRTEVYVLGDDFVDFGRSECRRLIDIEKRCRKANFWPHYANPGAADIFKPAWMV